MKLGDIDLTDRQVAILRRILDERIEAIDKVAHKEREDAERDERFITCYERLHEIATRPAQMQGAEHFGMNDDVRESFELSFETEIERMAREGISPVHTDALPPLPWES